MKYSRTDIAVGFVKTAQQHGNKKAVKELAALILELRLHGQVEEIIQDISGEYARLGFVEAEVKTAFKLSQKLKKQLETYVKNHTGAESVLLHEEVDKNLLAGIVLTAPGLELDTSLMSKLKSIQGKV